MLTLDNHNCTASSDLIEQHFCQIEGSDGALCAYLMRNALVPLPVSNCSDECTESFDNQVIQQYLILKLTEFLSYLLMPEAEPPLRLYTHEAAEDNAHCFQDLKHIVQGTEAKVYVDKFNLSSEFHSTWRTEKIMYYYPWPRGKKHA